jgi:hypothetical protein
MGAWLNRTASNPMPDDIVDDLLGRLLGEAIGRRLPHSRRAKLLWRVFFGLVGTGLAATGAVHFAGRPDLTTNTPLRLTMIAMFGSLACVFLFNVGLGRRWRWPGVMFVVCFILLFVTRIAFGR